MVWQLLRGDFIMEENINRLIDRDYMIPLDFHFDKDHGIWVLDSLWTLKLQKCFHCEKIIKETFWLCPDEKVCFCNDCNKNEHRIHWRKKYRTQRLCKNTNDTHVHLPIKAYRKEEIEEYEKK